MFPMKIFKLIFLFTIIAILMSCTKHLINDEKKYKFDSLFYEDNDNPYTMADYRRELNNKCNGFINRNIVIVYGITFTYK